MHESNIIKFDYGKYVIEHDTFLLPLAWTLIFQHSLRNKITYFHLMNAKYKPVIYF
jgi:hypothetical protein